MRRGSINSLWTSLCGDFAANESRASRPGFHAMAVYRFGSWLLEQPKLVRWMLLPAYAIGFVCVRNLYGIELPCRTRVGNRLFIAHQSGIVVHPAAEIGDDCVLRHNVTIGAAGFPYTSAPKIGNRVEIGVGSVLMGGIVIGDDVRIGPNAVVMTNVPPGAVVTTTPARIIPSAQTAAARTAP